MTSSASARAVSACCASTVPRLAAAMALRAARFPPSSTTCVTSANVSSGSTARDTPENRFSVRNSKVGLGGRPETATASRAASTRAPAAAASGAVVRTRARASASVNGRPSWAPAGSGAHNTAARPMAVTKAGTGMYRVYHPAMRGG